MRERGGGGSFVGCRLERVEKVGYGEKVRGYGKEVE